MQRYLAGHVLRLTDAYSVAGGAEMVGLHPNDIKNLRAGNMPSLRTLVGLIRQLKVTPESLLSRGQLEPLSRGTNTRGVQERLVKSRIQKISRACDPAELAEATGLSIATVYQYRSKNFKVGLHTYLAFVSAGYSASELLLGSTKRKLATACN